jgi:hypothetical protein
LTRRATRRSARLGKPEIGDRAAGSEEMDEPVGEPQDQYAQPDS